MKRLWIILFVLGTVCLTEAQELLMPEGAYGTTILGGIKPGERKFFVLSGSEGQIFKAHILTRDVEKGASLELVDSKGASMLGGLDRVTKIDTFDLVLPKDDKYKFFVKGGKMKCSYILEVTLEDSEPMRPPESRPSLKPKPTQGAPSQPLPSPSPREGRPSKVDL